MLRLLLLLLLPLYSQAQSVLSIESIMADPKRSVGFAPTNPYWSDDGRILYFRWNPEGKTDPELYAVTSGEPPQRVPDEVRRELPGPYGVLDPAKTRKAYVKDGDLHLLDLPTMQRIRLTNTVESESAPAFNVAGDKLFFQRGNDLYALQLSTGAWTQITNFQAQSAAEAKKLSEQDQWLKDDQLGLFETLRQQQAQQKEREARQKQERAPRPRKIALDDKSLADIQISPNERYAVYRLYGAPKGSKIAQMPNYVTESGYTEAVSTRTKVGAPQGLSELWAYDIGRDSIFAFSAEDLEGIYDEPDYRMTYRNPADTLRKKIAPRKVSYGQTMWSADGQHAVVQIRSLDNKDRWIARLDFVTGKLRVLDRLRDEAWINWAFNTMGFLADNQTLYYQSEADGYAHLYTVNVLTGEKRQLTRGAFEVQEVWLSRDQETFYFISNEAHPGEKRLYRMAVSGGERVCLTPRVGAVQNVVFSPDETRIAYLFSSATRPWELYIQDNRPDAPAKQITASLSEQFKGYPWREPQLVTIPARDGAQVYGRLYEAPGKKGRKPAVIFVHGAGYLQNAHKWWSQYFREYMFHNLLADHGYTVLDLDFRASAGYGRDWRTAIYRNMGGPDLDDQVDAARWLVKHQGVDPQRIGIYGGSYGGFITLMAMFKTPEVFRAGAALRPVTDWAAYNHGYTSNILNTPVEDPEAYRRSSPIYHAEGLKGHLLICHGMLDDNVHFQDVVRLSQRLIELGKDHWELAVYPLEPHGFVEPSAWTDEYKRIFRLFERELKRP